MYNFGEINPFPAAPEDAVCGGRIVSFRVAFLIVGTWSFCEHTSLLPHGFNASCWVKDDGEVSVTP